MNSETHNEKNISLNDLVKFSLHSSQTYTGERLRQLMDSIESVGLINQLLSVRRLITNMKLLLFTPYI